MQKVICIDDFIDCYSVEYTNPKPKKILLTIGKRYEIINIFDVNTYAIIGDDGKLISVSKKRFITLEEDRDLKLNKILK